MSETTSTSARASMGTVTLSADGRVVVGGLSAQVAIGSIAADATIAPAGVASVGFVAAPVVATR